MSSERRENDGQANESTQLVNVDRAARAPSPYVAKDEPKRKFSPGAVLANRFIIIQFLGRGGMGEVYEAEDRLLQGVSVALKTIAPRMAETPGAQERFETEVLLARQITHPNVCPIYDICYHDDERGRAWFLSMKLLRGETLAARLSREKRLATEEAIRVIQQIAAALNAAHREEIIHRDIKPANIMLEGSGTNVRVVVMDFGLARKHESEISVSSAPQCAGTPGYLAPELLTGQPATVASDLYAFGVVLHEIFGGDKPTGDGAPLRVKADADGGSKVPPFAADLIADFLADEPGKRRRAFEGSLGLLDLASRGSRSRDATKPFWSRRHLLGAAVTTGGALIGGVAWKWEEITDPLLHPLPRKRFVALVNWPPPADRQLTPMLSGVVDAMERELSRAEAYDHDLLVLSAPPPNRDPAALRRIRDSLGANLVLASSAELRVKHVHLSLKILDEAVDRVLRQKALICSLDEITLLPGKAVRAAAELLGVSRYIEDNARLRPGTQSAAAYQAFEAAEALRRQPNDTGLEAAIEQYKTAVEQDQRYTLAHARLALAYCRLYALRREAAALDLAQANASTALELDRNSDEGHLALGWVLEHRGQKDKALAEMGKALTLDPSNPQTLVWLARVYSRLNQFPKAEELFRRVLKARPNYWLAYNELGEVLNKSGHYEEALTAYRTASLAQPKNALPLNNAGEMLLQLGRFREAKESLQKSLALKPSAWAAGNMAEVLRAQGKNAEAVAFGLKMVELDPADEGSWLELGDCYSGVPGYRRQARDAYSRAAQIVEQHLQTNSTDGPSWMLLALCQARNGKIDAARANVRKAESFGASELDSQIFKAQTLELAKERDEALAVLAACFRQGATKFQIASIADFQSLRADPRYLAISHSKRAPSNTAYPPK